MCVAIATAFFRMITSAQSHHIRCWTFWIPIILFDTERMLANSFHCRCMILFSRNPDFTIRNPVNSALKKSALPQKIPLNSNITTSLFISTVKIFFISSNFTYTLLPLRRFQMVFEMFQSSYRQRADIKFVAIKLNHGTNLYHNVINWLKFHGFFGILVMLAGVFFSSLRSFHFIISYAYFQCQNFMSSEACFLYWNPFNRDM